MGSHKYRRLLLKALKIAAGSGMAIIAAELLRSFLCHIGWDHYPSDRAGHETGYDSVDS